MNYKELSQKEINKVFLKACKADDLDLVKYLLTSPEMSLKAELNISKQTGFSNPKKDGFVPLIFAVQNNSKKVYKYFLEEINWFSTLSQEGKLEVLGKGTYPNDIETINYLMKKYEETTKINNYQKPFFLDKILEAVVDKNNKIIFDYLMLLPKEYKEHLNTKNDTFFKRTAKLNASMLEHILHHAIYKELGIELFLNSYEETKNNPESSLVLFKYALDKKWVDIGLTKKDSTYVLDKIKNNVLKTHNDSVLKYIHEQHIKEATVELLIKVINENPSDFRYSEDEHEERKKSNDKNKAPVLEYAIKNKLLTKETREEIICSIIKHGYKNLLNIISKYSDYAEGINLNKAFETILYSNDHGRTRYENLIKILDLDIDKKINIEFEDFSFFQEMENIKKYNTTDYHKYEPYVKKVFIEYDFVPDERLNKIYADNPEMKRVVELKLLNLKLVNKTEKLTTDSPKKLKI